jgi:predicted enzyme related to lactoylglutathione lyase
MVIRFGFNLLCRDIQAQMDFYARLLGLQEVVAVRSPIYRALQGEGFQLGFNGVAAYELLGIADRRPLPDEVTPVSGYPSLMLAQSAQVDAAGPVAVALGGSIVKPPFDSYYGQRQIVLCDPEGNVLRLTAVP